jgi:hypothetical protein
MVDTALPFTENGSSHYISSDLAVAKFCGLDRWQAYLQSNVEFDIIRGHPGGEEFAKSCNVIAASAKKAIFLDVSNVPILTFNNKVDKVLNGWISFDDTICVDGNLITEYCFSTSQRWEKRLLLSKVVSQLHIEHTGHNTLHSLDPQIKRVHVESLFTDFKGTILMLLDYCGLTCVRDNDFDRIFTKWSELQAHRSKDEIVSSIVDAVATNKNTLWAPLTLVDEAFVQMRLRDLHNLDMICYNVNVFPTNTTDLRKILINV